MTELNIQLEMERIDLLAKIEAFNRKAAIVGIEPIGGVGGNVTDTDAAQVEGKVFQYASNADTYLEKMGWVRVNRHSEEWMKGSSIAKAEPNPNGVGWVIVTM